MDQIVAICGPTCVGKTKYSIEIADELDGEIISCDSMQLYKYMDIGSAKPTEEERAVVRHHLVDEIDPREQFSVAKFQNLAKTAIKDILERDKLPVVCGGTGLYLNSLLFEMDFARMPEDTELRERLYKDAEDKGPEYIYDILVNADPEAAARIHPNNVKKVVRAIEAAVTGQGIDDFSGDLKPVSDYMPVLIGLTKPREELYADIDKRADILMELGLVDEVKGLLDMGLDADDISMKGIGYKEIIGYLNGEYDLDEAVRLIKRNTRHLAKRQMTWFKRYKDMKWFDISDYNSDTDCLEGILEWLRPQLKK